MSGHAQQKEESMSKYVRYGDEWRKEVMKNPKRLIVEMLRNVALERDKLYAAQQGVHPTLLEESIEVSCPQCLEKFRIGLPDSQSR